MMAGVYTFDATYAALFLKKKELATTLAARRNLGEQMGFGMAMPAQLKKMTHPETITDFDAFAQAGYPDKMLELMDEQLVRVSFMILLLNIFRGKKTFETAVAMEPRLKVLMEVKGKAAEDAPPFMMGQVTQKEVDKIREIVTPLRKNILNGKV